MAREQTRQSHAEHVDIIPLGVVDPMAVSVIAANIQTIMGLNAAIHAPLPEPEETYLPLRGQYAATKIIKSIENMAGGGRFKLGVVQFDICTPILKYVYGESQLGGRAAVISLHRLGGGEPKRLYLRAAKIGLHETGHLLGVGHCRAPDCLMVFSSNLERLDRLPLRFCSACEYEIARSLKHTFGRE
ncbi:MAG: hypothetical protein WAW37_01490 [Syntrophobacteraceae bacterium]